MGKKLLMLVMVLSLLPLAACAGIGSSPKGLETPIETAAVKLVADVKDGGYKLVSGADLNKWVGERKPMVIIDAMPASDFANGRIVGAVNAPLPKIDKEITPADKENLLKAAGADKNAVVVVYCGFVACRRSHWGAKLLVENGYANVYRYAGGLIAWKETGYPISR